MDPRPFRPTLDGLEPRLVPASAVENEVVAAYTRTVNSTGDLLELGTSAERGYTSIQIGQLAFMLPLAAQQSRTDALTLRNYRNSLQTSLAAASLPVGPELGNFIQQLAGAEVQATLNGVYADVYAVGFGGTPIVPPPPPPPPADGGTVFGPDLSGSNGTGTATSPPPAASTLPFSLSDPGFVAKSDGVEVWDVTTGSGAAITTGSLFTATYTGYLTDGTVFDSGTLTGRTLTTSNLIPGFVSGLDGMKVGGTRRIFIPTALAYGSNPPSADIPANADLVFEVNLTSTP
jgi:peptidylprolyl isomerase